MVNGGRARVRRREIGDADLSGLTALLVRGFPARPRAYWERGLRRMGERPAIDGCPRYGFMLDAGDGPVGAVLTLFHAGASPGGETGIRCNLSSWTVDPDYRLQAPLLVAAALKRPEVTYINLSPAPHTWPIIEAQGFVLYAAGQALVAPALTRIREPARAVFAASAWRDMPEAALLDDHARYGCACLVVEAGDGPHPFVFLPVRIRSGRVPLPVLQLIYCRDIADISRFAGVIGRTLLARGVLGVVFDGDVPGGDLVTLRRVRHGRRYVKGPQPPRRGDLSYTERVIFGP